MLTLAFPELGPCAVWCCFWLRVPAKVGYAHGIAVRMGPGSPPGSSMTIAKLGW